MFEFWSIAAGPLFDGMLTTLLVFVGAIVIATAGGLLIGALRLSRSRVVRGISWAYVEFFRGVSVLVLIFWAFFVLPLFGLNLTTLVTAWLVIGLNQSAFIGEIVRAGIQAVPRGQIEASIAINLSPWDRFRQVILPQALPMMLPPYANQLVNTLKETAVVSLIGLADLTFRANELRVREGHSLEIFLAIGVVYLVLAYLLTQGTKWLEGRTRVEPLRGTAAKRARTRRVIAGGEP